MKQPKKVAIVQSCYIPWKGYFDIINRVDEFIVYDDVQFTKRDWRTRNKVKTENGERWLTIPVKTKGKYTQNICDTEVVDPTWAKKHWNTICHSYKKTKYFEKYSGTFGDLYDACKSMSSLTEINIMFIKKICGLLSITTKITMSQDYGFSELTKSDRLIALCKAAGATTYLSGPKAKNYIDEAAFEKEGIVVEYIEYDGYEPYEQLHGEFTHNVTILDLFFNNDGRAFSPATQEIQNV